MCRLQNLLDDKEKIYAYSLFLHIENNSTTAEKVDHDAAVSENTTTTQAENAASNPANVSNTANITTRMILENAIKKSTIKDFITSKRDEDPTIDYSQQHTKEVHYAITQIDTMRSDEP